MKFSTNRKNQPSFKTPHITINNRGNIYFNHAYMLKAANKAFGIHTTPEGLVIDHDLEDFRIQYKQGSNICYCIGLANLLKDHAGTSIFPVPDLVGSFLIPAIEKRSIKTVMIHGTEYSITGLKNYINTLKARADKSGKEKTRLANKHKYETILHVAKREFPQEFARY